MKKSMDHLRAAALWILTAGCILQFAFGAGAQSYPYWDATPNTDPNIPPFPYQSVGVGQYVYYISSDGGYDLGGNGVYRWSECGGWETICYVGNTSAENGSAPLAINLNGNYLYIGGFFNTIQYPNGSTVLATNIAKYNLTNGVWSAMGFTDSSRGVQAITVDASQNIYIGTEGGAADNDTIPGHLDPEMLMKWDGSSWSGVGGGLISQGYRLPDHYGVTALGTDGTHIFVGGSFSGSPSVASSAIIEWDGANWHAMGAGLYWNPVDPTSVWVNAIAVIGTNVFVAGNFTSPSWGIARFSTATLASLPTDNLINNFEGLSGSGEGLGLAVFNSLLYVSGSFTTLGDTNTGAGSNANGIAYWDSRNPTAVGTWNALDSGLIAIGADGNAYLAWGYSLAANANAVFVTGSFTPGQNFQLAGSVSVPNIPPIARWVTAADPACSPEVSITSPTNGTSFLAPGDIIITADAFDRNGTISQVAFYSGTTLLGAATTAPYSFEWSPVAPGTYSLTAVLTDNNGVQTISAPVSVQVIGPSVAISSPANGANLHQVNPVLYASASETGGIVSSVVFYADNTLLGTGTRNGSVYQFTWINAPAGVHSLTAVATDNNGAQTTSAAVSVTVYSMPTVTITSPATGTVVAQNSLVQFTATASAGSGHTISQVQYTYNYGEQFGTSSTPPFQVGWRAPAGIWQVIAQVVDDRGILNYSTPITLKVDPPPVVYIASQYNGEVLPAGNIMIYGGSSDTYGTVTKIDVYTSAGYLGTAYSGTFNLTWNNVSPGNYSMYAIATDNLGQTTHSSVITFTVH